LVNIGLLPTNANNNLVLLQETIEAPPVLSQIFNTETPIEEQKEIPWSEYFIVLSSLISFFFLVRFFSNLITIYRNIQINPKVKWQKATLVLLEDKVLPYTFLNYIFIDKTKYENACIEPELFCHELAHVRQKHSLDVIFLELLRIIFWFNPLLYLFKQAIQLNHEFLADEAVNKTYDDVSAYQYLLLSKVAQTSGLTLTSNLNFQLTKKRLLMMTKITSASTAFIKKAVSVPLFIVLAFCLADFQLIAQEPTKLKLSPPAVKSTVKPHKLTKEDVNYENATVFIRGANGLPISKKYSDLTEEEKKKYIRVLYLQKVTPTEEEMEKWKNPKMYGVWIDGKRVANSEVARYKPTDIAEFSSSRILKNALNYGKHVYQLDIMTHDYYDNVYMKEVKASPILFIDEKANN
jgi:hypothetical protein